MLTVGRGRRGATYGVVLLVLVISMIMVFSFASLSTAQLRSTTALECKEHARNLAESAVYQAMDELMRSADFGTHQEVLAVDVSGYPTGSQAGLAFSVSGANALGIPRSYNNLADKNQRSVDGAVVPGETVRLVGLGRCGAQRVVSECLYYRPAFPTGLCTGGKVEASSLYLAGLGPGQVYNGSPDTMPPESLKPSDLHSNANLDVAVRLRQNCVVAGDVSAVGGADVGDANVVGVVRSRVAARQIPRLDLNGIRARMMADNVAPTPYSAAAGPISWFVEAGAPGLSVPGDIELDGGLLFVRGDLHVAGTIKGRGAIIATGQAYLGRGTALEARDQVALACGGKLTMRGDSKASHFFQGLVYTDGVLDVKNMTVVGTVVSHAEASLENVDLIQAETSIVASIGAPMAIRNNDDTVFWQVRAHHDSGTGEVRYDYQVAVYYAPWKESHDRGQYFVSESHGENKTEAELIEAMKTAADADYNAEQAQGVPSELLMQKLPGYVAGLRDNLTTQYTIGFDLNEVLSPTQSPRILMWRHLE